MTEKKKLAKLLGQDELASPEHSVLVGHKYLYHGGYGWQCTHILHYQTYLLFSNYHLNEVVALVYRAGFAVKKRRTSDSGNKERSRM